MAGEWNVSGLLLEGVSGSGKTALLRALLDGNDFASGGPLSTMILTEHQTQRVLEKRDREQGLTVVDNLGLLEGHVGYLESLNARLEAMEWCRKGQTNQRVRFVLERFHLTHVVQYEHMTWPMLEDIDRRLADLRATLVLLLVDEAALHDRLFSGRDEAWLSYMQRFGKTRGKIVAHFMRQQEEYVALADRSSLRSITVETGRLRASEAAHVVLDLWNTGTDA
jgi:hypothetical protein